MTTKTLHFQTKEKYRKWNAYRHIHNVVKRHPKGKFPRVRLHGKAHKVVHV